jgi:hypothetical protein
MLPLQMQSCPPKRPYMAGPVALGHGDDDDDDDGSTSSWNSGLRILDTLTREKGSGFFINILPFYGRLPCVSEAWNKT